MQTSPTFNRAQQRPADAERVLRDGLKRSPKSAALHHALGLALVRAKRNELALQELGEASRLEWELTGPLGGVPAQVNAEATKDVWDGVVGLRGRTDLSGNWYVPYYVDIGGGSSNFTWQAFGGGGYRYNWGDLTFGYRHLSYDFHNDRPLDKLAFSGPIFGVGFKF